MGTWCLRQTLIVLFSFIFLSSHIHLNAAVTDLICLADTVMKTDLNLSGFKKKFVQHLFVEPYTPEGDVVKVECLTRGTFPPVFL